MKVFELTEEVALITGGGTGIGKAIARCMVEAGAQVVITGRRENVLAETADELGKACHTFPLDVTDRSQTCEFVKRITQKISAPAIRGDSTLIVYLANPTGTTSQSDSTHRSCVTDGVDA